MNEFDNKMQQMLRLNSDHLSASTTSTQYTKYQHLKFPHHIVYKISAKRRARSIHRRITKLVRQLRCPFVVLSLRQYTGLVNIAS